MLSSAVACGVRVYWVLLRILPTPRPARAMLWSMLSHVGRPIAGARLQEGDGGGAPPAEQQNNPVDPLEEVSHLALTPAHRVCAPRSCVSAMGGRVECVGNFCPHHQTEGCGGRTTAFPPPNYFCRLSCTPICPFCDPQQHLLRTHRRRWVHQPTLRQNADCPPLPSTAGGSTGYPIRCIQSGRRNGDV